MSFSDPSPEVIAVQFQHLIDAIPAAEHRYQIKVQYESLKTALESVVGAPYPVPWNRQTYVSALSNLEAAMSLIGRGEMQQVALYYLTSAKEMFSPRISDERQDFKHFTFAHVTAELWTDGKKCCYRVTDTKTGMSGHGSSIWGEGTKEAAQADAQRQAVDMVLRFGVAITEADLSAEVKE